MKSRSIAKLRSVPKTFAELNALHPLRPINDRIDLDNAQKMIDLLSVRGNLTRDQDDYLTTLALLVEEYESEHFAIDTSHLSPIDMVKYLMQLHDLSESDLGRLLGERSLGNAILSGRRQLSKAHIRKLADHFKVSADLFL